MCPSACSMRSSKPRCVRHFVRMCFLAARPRAPARSRTIDPLRVARSQVVNTSEYALLAGPANVFLDNNFVAKTSLTGTCARAY